MKTQKKSSRASLILICLGVLFSGLLSCSKSDDTIIANCDNWTDSYLSEANAFSAAYTAYANDPTSVNCQSYKAAGLNYVAALESIIDCVPTGSRQEYIDSLSEYEAEIDAIECD